DKSFAGMRLDVFLAGRFAEAGSERCLSRAEIQRLIAAGQVTLNGATAKSSVRIKANDRIDIRSLPVHETSLKPEALPLEILFEDGDCLVINKAPGIVVHPAAGRPNGTLVNALLHHCKDLAGIGGERRPGIVHRLDKDTSGVMIVAKNISALHGLVTQFKNRQVRKEYLAFAWGKIVPAEGRIDRPIGRHRSNRKRMSSLHALNNARSALTEWQVLEYFFVDQPTSRGMVSFVRLRPRTGRTHQLRVHLADMGFPLIGDRVYGRKRAGAEGRSGGHSLLDGFPRQALHAEKLAIDHLRTGQRMVFHAPLAPDLEALLNTLRQLNPDRLARAEELSRQRG
ncbi:MAG: RluA family pseudouridine synthase, partial [Candidatus Binatia bacterium]